MTAQSVVLAKLATLWRAQRSGRYEVHRGFIDWTTWPFAVKPYAVALWVEEDLFLERALGVNHFDTIRLRMDIATRFANPATASGVHYGLTPATIDEIRDDAGAVCLALIRSTDDNGQSLVHRITDARAQEWHDAQAALQGRLVELTLDH